MYRERKERVYAAIDLKSFYASVECVERGLDAMSTHLVVADASRTEKTICLAVSPALKAYGISGRPRLFEVVQQTAEINRQRRAAWGRVLRGKSTDAHELALHPQLELDYIIAPPRMALYIDYSKRIYEVYLRHIAPEDMHVYSIDEVFMDLTDYVRLYRTTPCELVSRMVKEVFRDTGITATAGVGSNLYLAKVAMDILAKHTKPDSEGVRVAELDEMSYRERLWCHRPLTDFWRVGRGTARRLEQHGMFTMGDVARRSVYQEESLYTLFGVNAELLIDHAWGREPTRIADIKAYRPAVNSLSSGQVLPTPYTAEKARLVVREMADALALSLTKRGLVTEMVELCIGYDVQNVIHSTAGYTGALKTDRYGRRVPKPSHGTRRLSVYSASSKLITHAMDEIFVSVVDARLLIRRLTVVAHHVLPEQDAPPPLKQGELFAQSEHSPQPSADNPEVLQREHRLQRTLLDIKDKFGKNAILKGMNLQDGATARKRNSQIGGHQA